MLRIIKCLLSNGVRRVFCHRFSFITLDFISPAATSASRHLRKPAHAYNSEISKPNGQQKNTKNAAIGNAANESGFGGTGLGIHAVVRKKEGKLIR